MNSYIIFLMQSLLLSILVSNAVHAFVLAYARNGRFIVACVFLLKQPTAMFSFKHCMISRLGNQTNTLLLVGWAKQTQYTHVDEQTIFCINQD
jgi:hypothetical protein